MEVGTEARTKYLDPMAWAKYLASVEKPWANRGPCKNNFKLITIFSLVKEVSMYSTRIPILGIVHSEFTHSLISTDASSTNFDKSVTMMVYCTHSQISTNQNTHFWMKNTGNYFQNFLLKNLNLLMFFYCLKEKEGSTIQPMTLLVPIAKSGQLTDNAKKNTRPPARIEPATFSFYSPWVPTVAWWTLTNNAMQLRNKDDPTMTTRWQQRWQRNATTMTTQLRTATMTQYDQATMTQQAPMKRSNNARRTTRQRTTLWQVIWQTGGAQPRVDVLTVCWTKIKFSCARLRVDMAKFLSNFHACNKSWCADHP